MPDVILIVIIGTVLFILLVVLIIVLTFLYQKRRYRYQEDMLKMKEKFQGEILKARLEMQEQTFRNISQEIHDNIGQILSLIRLNISTLDQNNIDEKVSVSKELLDQAIQDLRDLSKHLNNEFINQQQLSGLLNFQLNIIEKTGLYQTSLELEGEEQSLNPETKLIVFRIAQEVINNILKHANAHKIWINLKYLSDRLTLSIRDDGNGFDISDLKELKVLQNGIGIPNMQYRAGLIGGKLEIKSSPGSGTYAELILPIIKHT